MENLEWLYGIGLIGAIVIGYLAVKKYWKIVDLTFSNISPITAT